MQLRRPQYGFSLTELAIVMAIVGLLIGGAMATLSTQIEQHNSEETKRRLDAAVEALLGYAIVNRRLPCPATADTTGDESPAGGAAACTPNPFGGFLPARTIGMQTVDAQFYALDAWGNRIRYALSNALTGCTGGPAVGPPFFTSQANLKANGVSCRPNDIDICAPTTIATACTAANRVVSTETVAFIVFSTGKNGAVTATTGHEFANVDGDASFIMRTPTESSSPLGAFDDILVWVPAGVLYSRLIAAGVLP